MQIEIERKFLVKDLSIIHQSNDVIEVTQGYLIQAPDRSVFSFLIPPINFSIYLQQHTERSATRKLLIQFIASVCC